MKTKNSFLTYLQDLLARPLVLVLFALTSQLALGLAVVFSAFAKENMHGAQSLLTPPDASALKGQAVYYQEGCQYCHTQNLRPFQWELKRFSNPEKLGYFPEPNPMDYYYESPFLKGSRRIGPDLSQTASLYDSSDALKTLLQGGGNTKLQKLLHSYAYLFEQKEEADGLSLSWRIRLMLQAGIPFSDAYQRSAFSSHELSRGEMLAAYLLSRGKKKIQFRGKFYRKE